MADIICFDLTIIKYKFVGVTFAVVTYKVYIGRIFFIFFFYLSRTHKYLFAHEFSYTSNCLLRTKGSSDRKVY